ncbi:hypothetical protein [Mycobacterium sp. 236(2023)]|uniref:hypothetical protein n=1 Tax=Mycobacterium sp. 236(2023) TaxID=3038163 RepID=UPI0024155C32|nr:hypothetical protein [Mycobacterium sp. 236(2023)]MDG4669362.1 hypothetical protein [Mycobacterium sp. 236(2023)]
MTTPPNWPGPTSGANPWPPHTGPHGDYPPPPVGAPQSGWNQPGYGYGPAPAFPPPPPIAPRRNRTPLIITAAAAAVLVIIGVIVAVVVTTGDNGPGSGGNATEVAKTYLDALTRGDASAALALSATQPPNSDLLTDDVLRQQLDALPMSGIEILGETTEPGAGPDRTSVKIALMLGDKRTESSIRMVRSDGEWKLDSSFVKVSTTASVETSTATTLVAFGAPVGGSSEFYAFPGHLDLTSSSPFIDVNPVAPLSFDDLGSMELLEAKYSMNEAGRLALEDAVIDRYQPCYGDIGPKPAQCAMNTFDPTLDDSTAKFTSPLDVAGLTYTFEGTLTSAMVSGSIKNVQITMRRTDGQTVPMTADLAIFMMVDIGTDPPKVLTK